MNPHTHFLFPFFIALVFSNILNLNIKLVFICGLIGMLVDLDHLWINKPHYFRIKISKLYLKESNFELILDLILIIAIVIVYKLIQ